MERVFKRVIFEKKALEYELGKEILEKFKKGDSEIRYSESGRITGIPGKTDSEMYFEGKNTLVVGVRHGLEFQSCKPSAHYQLPLVSGCVGMCEYCYLNTHGGKKPYIKVNVNVDEILDKAAEYINQRKPDITIFEGAATSDPIPVERYTGALRKSIEYFGRNEYARFRFVTKYSEVDSLLSAEHNNHTMIRFSANTNKVIKLYEHRTSSFEERVEAAYKVLNSGYQLGFIVGPVFLYDNWQEDYLQLIKKLSDKFKDERIEFEIISHRFTKSAKSKILSIFPSTELPMEEELRKFKFGQFGYGKYIYNNEQLDELKKFFTENISSNFNKANINYII